MGSPSGGAWLAQTFVQFARLPPGSGLVSHFTSVAFAGRRPTRGTGALRRRYVFIVVCPCEQGLSLVVLGVSPCRDDIYTDGPVQSGPWLQAGHLVEEFL